MWNSWQFWVVVYLISTVMFSQVFHASNRKMKDAGALTILLEGCTAFFACLFIPFFPMKWPTSFEVYITLGIVMILYAITDRLNIEARYGLAPSTFSMLKQLSTVFLMIFGFLFLREPFVLKKVIGACLIVLSNIFLAFDNNGKICLNKYFIMSFISNFLFAIAMLINVNISDNFNLGIYTVLTVSIPALIIFIFGKYSVKKLQKELSYYDKKRFLLTGFSWAMMLLSSVRAYQLESVTVVAPLLTLTAILNVIYEFIVKKNKQEFFTKLLLGILIFIGVLLIKS